MKGRKIVIGAAVWIILLFSMTGCAKRKWESECLNRVWITKENDYKKKDPGHAKPSVVITEIENDKIKGKFCADEIAIPDSYAFYFHMADTFSYCNLFDFEGEIEENHAECIFYDDEGNSCGFSLAMGDRDELWMELDFDKIKYIRYGEKVCKYEEKQYRLLPYNVKILKEVIPVLDKKTIKTKRWGKVHFAEIREYYYEDQYFGHLYMIDEKENVVYKFCKPSTSDGSLQIADIEQKDINNDQREDIIIKCGNLPGENTVEFNYFQMENGAYLYE